jgi:hypothetical protein
VACGARRATTRVAPTIDVLCASRLLCPLYTPWATWARRAPTTCMVGAGALVAARGAGGLWHPKKPIRVSSPGGRPSVLTKKRQPATGTGRRNAPRGIRTPDTRFRRPMLYPLSYGCNKSIIAEAARTVNLPKTCRRVRPPRKPIYKSKGI